MKIMKVIPVLTLLAAAIGAQQVHAEASEQAVAVAQSFDRFKEADEQFRFLSDNCMSCHNAEDWAGSLAFDLITPEELSDSPEIWEKVISKLQGRMMPPAGQPRPDNADADEFIAWTEQYLDHAASSHAHVGRVGLHRLNRKEYGNAVRDLFGIEVDAASLLPNDASVEGFDNIAEALRASPSFLDQSLSAARVVVAQAVGNPSPRAGGSTYNARGDQNKHIAGLPLGTRGGLQVEHYFPADGEYVLNIGNLAAALWVSNQEFTHTLIATLDGVKFFETEIGGGEQLKAIDQIGDPAVDEINSRLKDIRFTATAGPHKLAVTFVQRSFAEYEGTLVPLNERAGNSVVGLNSIEVLGPYNPAGLSTTPARERIFSCYPASADAESGCAREIISRIARQAYRGRATEDDVDKLMQVYQDSSAAEGFELGLRHALTAVIASPKFLYRVEQLPENVEPGAVVALDEFDIASRLSFFLWSSIPDEQLLDLAEAGELGKPEVMRAQVERMLQDPRAQTLASNFAYQWLALYKMDEVEPDPDIFRGSDFGIRPLLEKEVELFTRDVFLNNKPVTELLTADYTYLNERLALHYDIEDVKGDEFRKVELGEMTMRYGLLGKGALLMASSYPDRTSPVLRGNYVLEFILGTPPPLPPPNVEALVDNKPGAKAMTIKQRLEVHRNNPSCGGCHGFIDPLGFALENFDSIGRYRQIDHVVGEPVDTASQLPDGQPIGGIDDLREALVQRPQLFAENVSESLLIYALGRPVEAEDMPAVRRIVREAEANDFRFFDIVLGVVNSDQFRFVEAPEADEAQAVAGLQQQ
jgi:mono/diheme cytochrome c family protein